MVWLFGEFFSYSFQKSRLCRQPGRKGRCRQDLHGHPDEDLGVSSWFTHTCWGSTKHRQVIKRRIGKKNMKTTSREQTFPVGLNNRNVDNRCNSLLFFFHTYFPASIPSVLFHTITANLHHVELNKNKCQVSDSDFLWFYWATHTNSNFWQNPFRNHSK